MIQIKLFVSLDRPVLTPYSMAFETKLILQKLTEKCWQNMYLDRGHLKSVVASHPSSVFR